MRKHAAVIHDIILPTMSFPCTREGCGATFTQAGNMRKHVAVVHDNDRPFPCSDPNCEFRGINRDDLVRHVRAMHSDEAAARLRVSENALATTLQEAGIDFKREHRIDFTCADPAADDKFFRIDFLIPALRGKTVLIENDERQHDAYDTSCDVKRMAEICESLAVGGHTMRKVFIRFNPDAFRRDGVLQRHVPQKTRRAELVRILRDPSHAAWTDERPVVILHMFYDTTTRNRRARDHAGGIGGPGQEAGDVWVEEPTVVEEYGYLKDVVLPCIVDVRGKPPPSCP